MDSTMFRKKIFHATFLDNWGCNRVKSLHSTSVRTAQTLLADRERERERRRDALVWMAVKAF